MDGIRNLFVTFDLEDADAAEYSRAYKLFAELGFRPTIDGARLPTTTVFGRWYSPEDVGKIRDAIWVDMRHQGVKLSHLLVIEHAGAAWYGPKV